MKTVERMGEKKGWGKFPVEAENMREVAGSAAVGTPVRPEVTR